MFSIIIPAYNEEKRIGKMLESYGEFYERKKREKEIDNFELLVVINNTKDKTEEIVKIFSKKYKEIKFLNFEKGGKGFAVIEGFKDALKRDNEFIGFVDADMSTPPETFYGLIKNVLNNKNIDGIIANRWDKRSKITPRQSILRRFVSRGYNFIVKTLFLFPFEDTQCGAKFFRREILEKNVQKIITSNWGFDIALLYCLKKESNARIKSIPTFWQDKVGSAINLRKTPLIMFASCIRLRLIHSPFKFIVKFYRKLPAKLKFH
ncbi:MAG: glycosyltransferase [Candidatus Pacearchaeota archaeon]|nr:glycosyltransferase [Candidatus Pacearchaeota archaeon]